MMNNNKGNFILLMVIAISTFLVAIAGATFAYLGAKAKKNDDKTTIEVSSGTLSIEYEENSKIYNGSVPSGTMLTTKDFSITGSITGSTNLSYQLSLNLNNNTYDDGALNYTLVSTNDSNNGTVIASASDVAIPSGTGKIPIGVGSFNGPTGEGAKHSYVLIVSYLGNDNDDRLLDANVVLENFNE